jgi:LysM repeat protein
MPSLNLTEIGAGVAKVGDRYYWAIDCAQPTANGAQQAYTPDPNVAATESFSSSDFIVPVVTNTPDKNGLVYHEVQYGQTLWAIAIEYGIKIDEIRALNNLGATTEIYPGDKLLIRKDISPSPVPATSTTANTKVPSVQFSTVTGLPTLTLLPTETLTPVAKNAKENFTIGIAVGVVLITLLFAGMLTWIGSRRST